MEQAMTMLDEVSAALTLLAAVLEAGRMPSPAI